MNWEKMDWDSDSTFHSIEYFDLTFLGSISHFCPYTQIGVHILLPQIYSKKFDLLSKH